MTKCIFRSVFLAAFAVFIACLVLVMGALYSYFSARQESQLAIEAKLAAAGVESGGEAYLENFGRQDGLRLTWIDSDGTVLYDTNADASSMENHADREEVAQALQTGSGEGKRSIIEWNCTGCGKCVDSCKHGCIELRPSGKVHP